MLKSSLRRPRITALQCCVAATAVVLLSFAGGIARAQARREVTYTYTPSQLTFEYQRTLDDYQLLEPNGSRPRVTLNGVTGEFSYRRFYPWEIVGRVSYAKGDPVGQTLASYTAGVGYTRRFFRRFDPFARVTLGVAHTSSTDNQYLYTSSKSGFVVDASGGLDVELTPTFGIRAIEVQNQYLPFGVDHLGSVYWSYGAGAFIRF